MKKLKLITLTCVLAIINSCSETDEPKVPKGDYEHGYFISNEGPFQNGSGTVSFVGDDGTTSHHIYKSVNAEDLGNVVNSISMLGDKAYIVVNNSNKVVVANRFTMEKVTSIEGEWISNPRYLVFNGNYAYLSNWGDPLNSEDDFISVIDLNSNSVIDNISVGEGPENMQIENNKLFVALEGGWNQNNKVLVIDLNSNTIQKTIEVGDLPNSINLDGFGNVWVLCGGNPSWTGNETSGSLVKINAGDFETSHFEFDSTEHPEHLTAENGVLYYNLNGKVFKMNSGATEIPDESMDGLDGFYYNLKAYNGDLYTLDAKDYASEGALKVFNLTSGDLLASIQTGIIPGDIAF